MNEKTKKLLDRAAAEYVTCAYADMNGELRGHLVGRDYFESVADTGLSLVAEAMVLGPNDEILLPDGYLSFDRPFSDEKLAVAVNAPRTLPDYPDGKNLFFFLDFPEGSTGALWAPRQAYARAEARLAALGFTAVVGAEYEFRVLAETEDSVREKRFRNLKPLLNRSGYLNVGRQSQGMDFIAGLLDMCRTLEIDVAGVHWEHGRSMLEVALAHQKGMRAADNAALFKNFAKIYAARRNGLASFMAKPLPDEDGAANHVHLSVQNRRGGNAFHDPREEHGISTVQRHFVGGIQKLLPELMLMMAPNPNSWRRYVPDAFAPLAATWGVENRSTSVRVVPGSRGSQRLEFRAAGADTNPYLVQACLIAMGAWGIEHQLEPLKPVEGSAYPRQARLPKSIRFPAGFKEAVAAFRSSKAARDIFGDDFVKMFAGTRQALLAEVSDKRGRASLSQELGTLLIGA